MIKSLNEKDKMGVENKVGCITSVKKTEAELFFHTDTIYNR